MAISVKIPRLQTVQERSVNGKIHNFSPIQSTNSGTQDISASDSQREIISARALHKSFHTAVGEIQVLNGIDLDIYKQEFIIIFGPSGSGKSTLLHSLIGLEEPTKGSIKLFGQELYDLNEDERSMLRLEKIGIMYQQPIWVKAMDVLHNIALPLSFSGTPHREALKIAKEKLKNYAMEKYAYYKPTELSSGQQQKISLVRALISEPEILIADEPTGNLDIDSSKRLIEGLKELNIIGRTVIMITHDLQYLAYADRTFYINDGKLAGVYNQKETKVLIDEVVNKGKSIFNLSKTKNAVN